MCKMAGRGCLHMATCLIVVALIINIKIEAKTPSTKEQESQISKVDVEEEKGKERTSDEVRLVRFLLNRYEMMGKVARPTYNSSSATPVWFGLRLIQLELDEREQLMRTSVWVRYRWIDEYLRWDPNEFGGLDLITLPWDKVWVPDIVLVNTASTSVAERAADIMVSNEGGVFWSPHRMYKSGCLIDISNYPFDQHTCDLWYQSMSHFSWHLDLKPFPGSPWDLQTYLASYKESQGWEIIRNATDRFDANRKPGLILKFSKRVTLLFTMTVKRRPGYTCHLLMMPCIFLGALTLVVFCLPAERPDRITLAMSLFASFLVLLLILVEAAPPSAASVPQLGVYYACNMVLIMTSVFLSATVVNVARGGERRVQVPSILRFIFIDVLARPLLLHGLIMRILGPKRVTLNWKSDQTSVRGVKSDTKNGREDFQLSRDREETTGQSEREEKNVTKSLVSMDERLQRLEAGRGCGGGNCLSENCDYTYITNEWKMVSMVMDRLFFVLYITALILSAVIFFPRPEVDETK